MMKYLFTLALLFVGLISFAQSQEISFKYKDYNIEGTYLKAPRANGTAVLIIAGSGATDRDGNNPMMESNAYKFLVEHLAKRGVSSLRYDKLGIAASASKDLKESDLLFIDNVDVAEQAYKALEKQKGVKRIVIIGHSEGSTVGMILAQRVKAYKYVSLAGPGYSANEILNTQFKASIPAGPLQDVALSYLDSLAMGKSLTGVNPMLASFFRPSMMDYLIDWFKYDPRKEIAKLNIPVLVIQGDNDAQVSNDNAEVLAKANAGAKKVLVKEVNHILKIAPRDRAENIAVYNSPEKDIAEDMRKALVDFVLE